MALAASMALFAASPCAAQPPRAKIAIAVALTVVLEPYGCGTLEGTLLAIEEANENPGEIPIDRGRSRYLLRCTRREPFSLDLRKDNPDYASSSAFPNIE